MQISVSSSHGCWALFMFRIMRGFCQKEIAAVENEKGRQLYLFLKNYAMTKVEPNPDNSVSSLGNQNTLLYFQSNLSGTLWRFLAHMIFFYSSLYLAEGGDSTVWNQLESLYSPTPPTSWHSALLIHVNSRRTMWQTNGSELHYSASMDRCTHCRQTMSTKSFCLPARFCVNVRTV